MLEKIRKQMKVIIIATAAIYVICVLAAWINYLRYPLMFEVSSAPWYKSIIIYSIIYGGALVIDFIILFFVSHRINKKKD